MPSFIYKAIDNSGSELKGYHEATDLSSASQELRDRGLRILEVKLINQKSPFLGEDSFGDWYASQRSVSTAGLVFFFKQMSFLLRAGVPAAEALSLIQYQISSPRLKLIAKKMLKDVESGSSLSRAMKKHDDVFSDMIINLIVAAENTGELDEVMTRLANHIEKKAAIRAQTINALIYPVVVVIAAIGVTVFLLTTIVPKIADILLRRGKTLPDSTQFLVNTSTFLQLHGITILIVIAAFIMMIALYYQTKPGRYQLDSLLLKLPVIGNLLIIGAMAQMTWALSILLKSGVTVYEALRVAADVLGNKVYSTHLKASKEKIIQGRDLSSSLNHKKIPIVVLQMIAVGENTGSLDDVLSQLGKYYEEQLEAAIKRLTAMIEPVLILVIGGIVGFVYYAFIKALMSII